MKFLALLVFAVGTSLALPAEKSHLVSMRKEELMTIIKCVNKEPNYPLCVKFEMCEKMMPKQVKDAYEHCQRKCIGGGLKTCSPHEPLFVSPDIPRLIFDCIQANTRKLKPAERREMVEFEKCSKALYDEHCKPPVKYH